MKRMSAEQAAQVERGEITTKDIIDLDQQELEQLRQENDRLRAELNKEHQGRQRQWERYIASGYLSEEDVSLADFVDGDLKIAMTEMSAALDGGKER